MTNIRIQVLTLFYILSNLVSSENWSESIMCWQLIDWTLLVPHSKIAKVKAIQLNSSQIQVWTELNDIESRLIDTLLVPAGNILWIQIVLAGGSVHWKGRSIISKCSPELSMPFFFTPLGYSNRPSAHWKEVQDFQFAWNNNDWCEIMPWLKKLENWKKSWNHTKAHPDIGSYKGYFERKLYLDLAVDF